MLLFVNDIILFGGDVLLFGNVMFLWVNDMLLSARGMFLFGGVNVEHVSSKLVVTTSSELWPFQLSKSCFRQI